MGEELPTCAQHGLRYDPKLHPGCVLCRRSTAPRRPASGLRPWHLVLAGALVVSLAVGARLLVARRRAALDRVAAADSAERDARRAPVLDVAPAPLPTGLPLIGPDGNGPDGYPLRYVDRPALRSLLVHERYAELTADLEQFQADFEADPTREYWPDDAADAFHSAEPEIEPSLDAWVKATPGSFAPYLARGAHWASVAYARRGDKWASETPASSFAAMDQALAPALHDLDAARKLRPKLVAAMTQQIQIAKYHADNVVGGRARAVMDGVIAVCPTCFIARTSYMLGLEPRWGGTYALMDAFATASATYPNPRLRLLAGYADRDRAAVLWKDKRYDDALAALGRACALGDFWAFLDEKARIEEEKGDVPAALVDLDRAHELRPGASSVLFHRSWANDFLKHYEAAGRDLLDGLRVDPTDAYGRGILDSVVKGLDYAGWQAFQAGQHDAALRIYDLAAALAPRNTDVLRRRTSVLQTAADGGATDVATLEAAAEAAPDDFEAHRALDYALARTRQYDRIIAMWTKYIAAHPQDGRAYLERGGAYFDSHRLSESHADASTACDLGVTEACTRKKQVESLMR